MFYRMRAPAALASLLSRQVLCADLLSQMYTPLPLGAVKPAGWLLNQLNIQANGLHGHEFEFYKWVANGTWTGGSETYSDLNEGGSYWFNGNVGAAFLLDDSRLKSQVQQFLDYVLDHQGSDGWLGPEPRTLWGRYPFLLGAMQFAQADPTQTDKIVTAMMKFVSLANSMLHNNSGSEEWGQARWQDFALVCQWLYDNHANGQEALLLDTMQILKSNGTDWPSVFSPSNFPSGSVSSADSNLLNHGVNIGQALKSEAVAYRFTQAQSDIDSTSQRWDILYQYHGRPSGIFGADEHLAGLGANRGSELCMVVETMFSGSYVYQSFGNNSIADKVEKIAYNALPATLTGDFWQHQYLQQLNQVWTKSLSPNPFLTDGAYSNVFGEEPNYPCCAVNHGQGYPKFVSNAFATAANNTKLIQIYHGPFSVSTTLANNNAVNVSVDTAYPFSDNMTVTISASAPYTHLVRIPTWAKGPTLALNGGGGQNVSVGSDGLLAVNATQGTTKYVLTLPAEIETSKGPTSGVQVTRGPLFWSSDIFHTTKTLSTDPGNANATDLEFDSNVAWQFAVDPSTLTYEEKAVDTLPNPIFASQQPPNTITATGCPITWTTNSGAADDPPNAPSCNGGNMTFIFWPYGSTKLHIGELPAMAGAQKLAAGTGTQPVWSPAQSSGSGSSQASWATPTRVLSNFWTSVILPIAPLSFIFWVK